MAITKIHPIRSTIDKALNYIMNDSKTDGKLLVSGIECSPQLAASQFKMTKRYFDKSDGILAFHLIQSFGSGEVNEELAHQIGLKLAEEITNGKHQAVVCTHIDRGHIHNHIVFNSVSHIDGRKYNACKNSYRNIRQRSDALCNQYGLSIIIPKNKGKSYKEWIENQKGLSWKTQIKTDIDETIKVSSSFKEFLVLIRAKGYVIKEGKYMAFRPQDKERFVRGKTLGFDYSESSIRSRIALRHLGVTITTYKSDKNRIYLQPRGSKKRFNKKGLLEINIMLAIRLIKQLTYKKQNNKNAKLHYVKKYNDAVVQKLSKQLVFIRDENIQDFQSITNKIKEIENQIKETRQTLKKIESTIEKPQQSIQMQQNQFTVYENQKKNYAMLKKRYQVFLGLKDTVDKIKSKNYPFYNKDREIKKDSKNYER